MIPIPKDVYDEHTLTLSQVADSCQSDKEDQEIRLFTDNAGGDNFLVMITKRWSIDLNEIDQFIDLLRGIQRDWRSQNNE